jgi:predicted lipoprotein with Yx(FWY)xxD motif
VGTILVGLPFVTPTEMPPRAVAERGVEAMGTTRDGLAGRAAAAAVAAVGIAVLVPALGPAQAASPNSLGATVVQVVNRSPIGNMLATTSGASLYFQPTGTCTGGCLTIWPPLLMPAGKTKPKGAACLSTVMTSQGLQVTYHSKRLYTFTGDSGTSVNGNGVGGFKAAKVTTACP